MAKLFNVSISSPDKTLYEGAVRSLVAPSKLGYLGILADHAPLIATLAKGRIILKEDSGREEKIFDSKGGGFLEVMKNKVTILLDGF